MRTAHGMLKQVAKFAALLMLGASMSACAGLFGQREFITWQEEVKLNDGRVIVVTQKKRCSGAYTGGNYASCIAREAWLTIMLAEFGNQEIVWHEHLSPRVLNVDKGRWYVVGIPPTCLEFRTYGNPVPMYVGFVLDDGKWKRIPFSDIPEAIYDTNMLMDAFPPNDIDFLTLSKKESRAANGNPDIRSYHKRIEQNVKNNCH